MLNGNQRSFIRARFVDAYVNYMYVSANLENFSEESFLTASVVYRTLRDVYAELLTLLEVKNLEKLLDYEHQYNYKLSKDRIADVTEYFKGINEYQIF